MSEFHLAVLVLSLLWVFVSPVVVMAQSMSGYGFWADYKAAFKSWHLLWFIVAAVTGTVCAFFWALHVIFN